MSESLETEVKVERERLLRLRALEKLPQGIKLLLIVHEGDEEKRKIGQYKGIIYLPGNRGRAIILDKSQDVLNPMEEELQVPVRDYWDHEVTDYCGRLKPRESKKAPEKPVETPQYPVYPPAKSPLSVPAEEKEVTFRLSYRVGGINWGFEGKNGKGLPINPPKKEYVKKSKKQ